MSTAQADLLLEVVNALPFPSSTRWSLNILRKKTTLDDISMLNLNVIREIAILCHISAIYRKLVKVWKVLQRFTIKQFHPSGFETNEIIQSKMSKTNWDVQTMGRTWHGCGCI